MVTKPELASILEHYGINVVHRHGWVPCKCIIHEDSHASAAYMAKQILSKQGKKLPVITTLHGTDITLVGRDKTYSPVVTFSMEESDILTAVSENLKEETYRNFKIDKPIEVINNFVDISRFNKKPVSAFKKLINNDNSVFDKLFSLILNNKKKYSKLHI